MSNTYCHPKLATQPPLCEPRTQPAPPRAQDTCVHSPEEELLAPPPKSLPLQQPPPPQSIFELAESLLGFSLHDGQRQILDPALKRGILNCSRQWGKSTVAALKAAFHAHFHPNQTILIGSPSGRQSQELLFKAHGFLRKLTPQVSRTQSLLTLPNRSRVIALPNSPDNVRGYSADLVILDEAARISDELYSAILPSISARREAPLLLLSTPAGKKGYYFKAWNDNSANWVRIHGPAAAATHLDSAFVEEERRLLSPVDFAQEYECGFGLADGAVFDPSILEDTHDPTIPALDLYSTHMSDCRFHLGVDFGLRRDHSALVLVDMVQRVSKDICKVSRARATRPILRVRYVERFPLGTPYPKIVEHIERMMQPPLLRNNTTIVADATGVGGGIVPFLERSQLNNDLQNITILAQGESQAEYYTNKVAKKQLIDFLKLIIDHRFLAFDHGMQNARLLIDELQNFEEVTSAAGNPLFRASGSRHDDLVIALALAVWKAYRWKQKLFDSTIRDKFIRFNEVWNGRHEYIPAA